MLWFISFAKKELRRAVRKASRLKITLNEKFLPIVGFDPGTFRTQSERATTELRGLMYVVLVKLYIVLPVLFL